MKIRRVLIIDDGETDQFLAKAFLQKFDERIEALQAYDGVEGLEMLEANRGKVDLVLLDINMPRMNGIELLEKLAASGWESPAIVVLSSSDDESDRERTLSFSCVKDYLVKPLAPADLERLSELL